ncbi:biotin/lipoyl-containing protein [Alicyclobacillus tolerans]|uniref:2-oxoglutarate dehydrogenase E2 component (Dihydrolipoamide succinyltransferase) n=2 Tax=Alicyclobacillus tolerans TaxID=90970 RepID=A0ABT9LV06_9BACL|nr:MULTISPECIES: biotin/lipoyl-containing protein [Alicyclobacillus]MDP9728107.1 2-oxoglutarate dehydrogenase E2 component (dihydrolipoamide succinyltransferase) [Alicyclobacillus tengchongensis]QRF23337.1 biotin attachment protein [Alicyclobacillus sp. TC]SHL03122.1 2-oxoglutarate dehydrogenase E2 component (dihydrolipoamide succinyltransferase) [Alicyclobacillus montanus]
MDVKLPQLGDTVQECLVTSWLKQIGDSVTEGDGLLEVTTDKVTIEVPAEHSGILKEQFVKVGDRVLTDQLIARIESLI